MGLKPDRDLIEDDITQTCQSVAQSGATLVHSSAGSGIALGASAGSSTLVANPSGYKVAGLLLHNVAQVDWTRFRLNRHNDETAVGERCRLLRKGRVTTDKVTGTPTDGATAYLTSNGVLTPTVSATGGVVATPRVGAFAGSLDESGYAPVDIDLPIGG